MIRKRFLSLMVCWMISAILALPVAAQPIYTAATETLIRQVLAEMEIDYEQNVDDNGDPIWTTLVPYDPTVVGSYASLLFFAGWNTEGDFPLSAINEWNRTSRFGRAYVDDQGDPVVELDLLLAGGVTAQTIKEYINVFTETVISFGATTHHCILQVMGTPPSSSSSSYAYVFRKDLFSAGICLAREKQNTKNKDQAPTAGTNARTS